MNLPSFMELQGAGTEWSIPQLYPKWVHNPWKTRKHSYRVWTSCHSGSSRVQELRGPSLSSIPNEYTIPEKQESIHVGYEPPTTQGAPGCRSWEVHPSTPKRVDNTYETRKHSYRVWISCPGPGCRDWEVHPSTLSQKSRWYLPNKKAFI